MKKHDVIKYFRTATATAEKIGVTIGAVSQWPELIPEGRAWQIEALTGGSLRVNPADYAKEKSTA